MPQVVKTDAWHARCLSDETLEGGAQRPRMPRSTILAAEDQVFILVRRPKQEAPFVLLGTLTTSRAMRSVARTASRPRRVSSAAPAHFRIVLSVVPERFAASVRLMSGFRRLSAIASRRAAAALSAQEGGARRA
jgi:hypothetical protein